MRVVIADNDEPFLDLLQAYLWNFGHKAEITTTGIQCIATMRQLVPDVLVVDNELLWGGGAGVVAEMSSDRRLCQIPIILLADSQEEFDDLANPQVITWLPKPFRLHELLRWLTSAAGSVKFSTRFKANS